MCPIIWSFSISRASVPRSHRCDLARQFPSEHCGDHDQREGQRPELFVAMGRSGEGGGRVPKPPRRIRWCHEFLCLSRCRLGSVACAAQRAGAFISIVRPPGFRSGIPGELRSNYAAFMTCLCHPAPTGLYGCLLFKHHHCEDAMTL